MPTPPKRPRRSPGEGTIRQRADGRFEARWTDRAGKQRSLYDWDRETLRGKLADVLHAQRRGARQAQAGRLTLGAWLTEWLEQVHRPQLEPTTYARYETVIRVHLVPALGSRPLSRLTARELQGYFTAKVRGRQDVPPLAASTLRVHYAILHRALGVAVKWGYLASNPVDLVELPKLQRTEPTILEPDEAAALLAAVHGHRLEALYVLALETGLRIGELVALQWSAVDLTRGVLHVRRKLVHLAGATISEGAPKSVAGRRSLRLSPRAVAALGAHKQRQAGAHSRAPAWARPDLVFTTVRGQALRGSTINRQLRELAACINLPGVTPHTLRRTFGSVMLAEHVPVEVVSKLMGHANINVTLNAYRGLLRGETEGALEALWGALGANGGGDSATINEGDGG